MARISIEVTPEMVASGLKEFEGRPYPCKMATVIERIFVAMLSKATPKIVSPAPKSAGVGGGQ